MKITTWFDIETGTVKKFVWLKNSRHIETVYNVYMDCGYCLHIFSYRKELIKYKFIKRGFISVKKKKLRIYNKQFEEYEDSHI